MLRAALVLLCACGPHVIHDRPSRCTTTTSLGSQDEVAAVAYCSGFPRLEVRTAAPIDLSSLNVERVSGDLVIGPTVALEAIHLDQLRDVGGELRIISNTSLHGIYLPALEHAGKIVIEGNLGLTTIAAPTLVEARDGISLRDDHDLAFVDLDALATVKAMQIEGCPELPEDVITGLRARSQRSPDER